MDLASDNDVASEVAKSSAMQLASADAVATKMASTVAGMVCSQPWKQKKIKQLWTKIDIFV